MPFLKSFRPGHLVHSQHTLLPKRDHFHYCFENCLRFYYRPFAFIRYFFYQFRYLKFFLLISSNLPILIFIDCPLGTAIHLFFYQREKRENKNMPSLLLSSAVSCFIFCLFFLCFYFLFSLFVFSSPKYLLLLFF